MSETGSTSGADDPGPVSEAPAPIPTIREQVRRNAVALISLVVAITSLGYNTWRNETTEAHRNLRHASFRVVENLAQLQSVTNTLVYAPERDPNAWVEGWGLVLAIEALGRVLPDPLPERTGELQATWEANFEDLSAAQGDVARAADQRIAAAINRTTEATVTLLRSLD